MLRLWRWLLPVSVLPLLTLLAYGFRVDPRYVASPLVGRPAPAFSVATFDGNPLSFEAFRGRVVVVNFWASWCRPACYEEAPVLEEGWRQYRDRGVIVVGINIQDTVEASEQFVRDLRLTFPNVRDATGKISVEYGIYGVPETFFVGRDGRIASKHVGALTETVFRQSVESLLSDTTARNGAEAR